MGRSSPDSASSISAHRLSSLCYRWPSFLSSLSILYSWRQTPKWNSIILSKLFRCFYCLILRRFSLLLPWDVLDSPSTHTGSISCSARCFTMVRCIADLRVSTHLDYHSKVSERRPDPFVFSTNTDIKTRSLLPTFYPLRQRIQKDLLFFSTKFVLHARTNALRCLDE